MDQETFIRKVCDFARNTKLYNPKYMEFKSHAFNKLKQKLSRYLENIDECHETKKVYFTRVVKQIIKIFCPYVWYTPIHVQSDFVNVYENICEFVRSCYDDETPITPVAEIMGCPPPNSPR